MALAWSPATGSSSTPVSRWSASAGRPPSARSPPCATTSASPRTATRASDEVPRHLAHRDRAPVARGPQVGDDHARLRRAARTTGQGAGALPHPRVSRRRVDLRRHVARGAGHAPGALAGLQLLALRGHSARRHGAAGRPAGGLSDRMLESHVRPDPARVAREVHLEGIVQGVGFRPFVHGLATRLGLGGIVTNDTRGVLIEVEGGEPEGTHFLARLEAGAPPLAALTRVRVTPIPAPGRARFAIVASRPDGARTAAVSPDVATCADCLRELFDPGDRRHRYPFINCTNCGPRFTIVRGVPYDRPFTTMAGFAMCAGCAREYGDPSD